MDDQGIEPRMPEATDLQSAAVTNAARHPKTGSSGWDRTNDQLINSQLLLPLSYAGINYGAQGGTRTPTRRLAPKASVSTISPLGHLEGYKHPALAPS